MTVELIEPPLFLGHPSPFLGHPSLFLGYDVTAPDRLAEPIAVRV